MVNSGYGQTAKRFQALVFSTCLTTSHAIIQRLPSIILRSLALLFVVLFSLHVPPARRYASRLANSSLLQGSQVELHWVPRPLLFRPHPFFSFYHVQLSTLHWSIFSSISISISLAFDDVFF